MEGPAEAGAPSVFVSYAREDMEFVRRLCAALAGRHHQAWIDQIDLHPFDPDWTASVRSAIEACATFLVVISPQSIESEPCAAELAHAVAHNKRLAPILLREVDDAVWRRTSPALARPNWFLFRETDDFERSMQRLVDAIEADSEWVNAHSRLLVRAKDWERRVAGPLTAAELPDAERWLASAAGQQPSPLPLHAAFIRASREIADKDLAVNLLMRADRESKGPANNLAFSVLLAIEAYRLNPSPDAKQAVRRGLLLPRLHKVVREPDEKYSWPPIDISANGRFVAIAAASSVEVFRVPDGERTCVLNFSHMVEELCLSPSGRYLATWGNEKERTEDDPTPWGPLEVFRVSDGHRVAADGQSQIMAFAFSPGERFLAAGGFARDVSVFDLETGGVTRLSQPGGTTALAFHPSGRLLAVQAGDLFIRKSPKWGLQKRLRINGYVKILRFNDKGNYLLAAQQLGYAGYLHLWIVERRWGFWRFKRVPSLNLSSNITAVEYDTFSWAKFAVATKDGGVRLCWAGHGADQQTRIDEQARNTHEGEVTDLSFRVFNTRLDNTVPGLATASTDGTIREWIADEEIARAVHRSEARSVRYTEDGRYLVSATTNGGIYVWESNWPDESQAREERGRDAKRADESLPWLVERNTLEGDALIDEICRRLPRNLTREEWASAFGDEPYRATCPSLDKANATNSAG